MTASSDLDLILLYDFDPEHPDSDGARSLHGAHYFARFTQRLISAFTTRTNYGVLYEVDMRLRPSGRAGPVASHVTSFAEYQDREAWTWEHMALTRARVISSSPEFRAKIENIIREVLTRPRDAASCRQRCRGDAPRHCAGEGRRRHLGPEICRRRHGRYRFHRAISAAGSRRRQADILDVCTLHVLDNAARLGVLPPSSAEILRPAAQLYHDLTQILRLCVSERFKPETAGEDLLRVMARAGDAPDFSSLEARVKETQAEVRRVFRDISRDGSSARDRWLVQKY